MAQNPNFKINLSELFGEKIKIGADTKEEIGRRIIETIQDRCAEGNSLSGSKFRKYSEAYKKATGKSDPPDLYLEGDMLSSMQVVDIKGNDITIGWEKGSKEWLKAQNHNFGVTLLPREFMGLQIKEKKSIVQEFEDEI